MPLTPVEVRILGALIEKEATTPDNYPLSLNALTNACNQTTNREPVMDLREDAVKWAINSLRQQSLVRAIQPADSRVMKFQHLVTEKLNVDAPERAVLCVLMLRGAQTLGEIRSRTGRLAEFATVGDVEAAMSNLITRGLAAELPRRAGQKEVRYAQLLSGPAPAESEEITPDVAPSGGANDERMDALEATAAELRKDLADLRAQFDEFRRQFS